MSATILNKPTSTASGPQSQLWSQSIRLFVTLVWVFTMLFNTAVNAQTPGTPEQAVNNWVREKIGRRPLSFDVAPPDEILQDLAIGRQVPLAVGAMISRIHATVDATFRGAQKPTGCGAAAVSQAWNMTKDAENWRVLRGMGGVTADTIQGIKTAAKKVGKYVIGKIKKKITQKAQEAWQKSRPFEMTAVKRSKATGRRGKKYEQVTSIAIVWDKAKSKYHFLLTGDCYGQPVSAGAGNKVRLNRWSLSGTGSVKFADRDANDEAVFQIGRARIRHIAAQCQEMEYSRGTALNDGGWVQLKRKPKILKPKPLKPIKIPPKILRDSQTDFDIRAHCPINRIKLKKILLERFQRAGAAANELKKEREENHFKETKNATQDSRITDEAYDKALKIVQKIAEKNRDQFIELWRDVLKSSEEALNKKYCPEKSAKKPDKLPVAMHGKPNEPIVAKAREKSTRIRTIDPKKHPRNCKDILKEIDRVFAARGVLIDEQVQAELAFKKTEIEFFKLNIAWLKRKEEADKKLKQAEKKLKDAENYRFNVLDAPNKPADYREVLKRANRRVEKAKQTAEAAKSDIVSLGKDSPEKNKTLKSELELKDKDRSNIQEKIDQLKLQEEKLGLEYNACIEAKQ